MIVPTAIYCRISLDRNEDGLAIARQLSDCSDIAEAKKWEVTKIY
jgi:site-specific DNA recombinase